MKTLALALTLILATPFANATSDTDRAILNHPVLKAVENLLNLQNGGHCIVPNKADDIQWMCMGLLMPVDKPTVINSGCGFSVTITCGGKSTIVMGETVNLQVLLPSGKLSAKFPGYADVKITDIQ